MDKYRDLFHSSNGKPVRDYYDRATTIPADTNTARITVNFVKDAKTL